MTSEANDPATADHAAAEGALGHQAAEGQQASLARSDLAVAQAVADRQESSDEQAVLAVEVQRLVAESGRVAEAVVIAERKTAHERRRNRFWATVATLVTFALLGLLLAGLIQNHATNQQIASCVTPAGSCYKNSHRETANVVAQLNRQGITRQQTIERTTVAAVDCANKVSGITAVQACVDKAMGGK